MEAITVAIVAAGLLASGFVAGGIFGASVYHYARKQAEAVAKSVEDGVRKGVDELSSDIKNVMR